VSRRGQTEQGFSNFAPVVPLRGSRHRDGSRWGRHPSTIPSEQLGLLVKFLLSNAELLLLKTKTKKFANKQTQFSPPNLSRAIFSKDLSNNRVKTKSAYHQQALF
jgi:hypothetical protein